MLQTKVSILLSNYLKHPNVNNNQETKRSDIRYKSIQPMKYTRIRHTKKPTTINLQPSRAQKINLHTETTGTLPSICDNSSNISTLYKKKQTIPLPFIKTNSTYDTSSLDELLYYHINTSSSSRRKINAYSDQQLQKYQIDNLKEKENKKMKRVKTKLSKTQHYKIVNTALSKIKELKHR